MENALIPYLMAGPRTAAEIVERLGVSQPTVSRLLRRMAPEVMALGRSRAARYGLRREIRGPGRVLGGDLPVYRVDHDGRAREIGVLSVLHGGCWYESLEGGTSAVYDDLPWFLDDMRPQGFVGRALAQSAQDLDLPPRLGDWNNDHALVWLVQRGEDAIGNLIVGHESLRRFQARPEPALQTREDYPALAERALSGEAGGSSPGGEQPKFTAFVADDDGRARHVLVKFSEPLTTPSGRRWGDLLIAESHASAVLREAGIDAAPSITIERGRRMLLEVERFDRIGAQGRRGLFSLGVIDAEFVGQRRDWLATAMALATLRKLPREAVERIAWLSAFGGLIANTDMHFGNLSLCFDGRWPLSLAPAYDMLPMLYAPQRGEVRTPDFMPRPPLTRHLAQAQAAQPWAVRYWQRLADDARITPEFRAVAALNAERVASLRV